MTAEGLTLRAHLGETWDVDSTYQFDGWTPPPWCFESGQMRIAIAGVGVIDIGSVGLYSEPFQGKAVSWLKMGLSDGLPRWVIVVQTSPDTKGVTVTFPDGRTDSTTPQNGVAILTVPATATISTTPVGYPVGEPPTFEVDFEGGPESSSVGSDAIPVWESPEYRASCSPPPPALPEPGEQPEDPATAEAAVIEVMGLLYDPTQEPGTRGVYLDDDTGVAEAREQVRQGSYTSEADSASATIEELVFTAPDKAWFRYRIDTSGTSLFDRYGIAVLIDGTWLITRNTVCQDLSSAGGNCGTGWHTIVPPSATLDE